MMNLYAKINTFIHNIHVCRQYFSAICMDNVFLTTQARHMACVWLVMKKKYRHDFIFVGKSSNFAASTKKTGITPHNQSA